MLNSILPYVVRYSNVIATVTGIDIEVVDVNLVRIAGTGMYAQGVGQSIRGAGQVYLHVLKTREAVLVDNPREHLLCAGCKSLPTCRETLELCTPIVYDNQVLGVIGLVCFNSAERERVLAQKNVFQDFVQQIAEALSKAVQEQQHLAHTRQWLDMLMQIVDGNTRGIMVFDSADAVTYINDAARQQLGLPEGILPNGLRLRKTGDALSGAEEFTLTVGEESRVLMGHLSQLASDDPAFSRMLVFDSLPRFTEMLSQAAGAEGLGGLASIVGKSRVLQGLKQKVLLIARTSSTVLITGESGTGKEMFARAIHAESDRRDKPFIAINCGAIPDALLESELFGYVRGAFTGASPSGRMGKFELAHQGVLFLDEISSIPLYLQVKLLRVLQERCIVRLGSNRLVAVDVRIIAATNDNLPDLISQRMFRDDLYYRLNVIPLEIPPLRDRNEDIPALAEHFFNRYCLLFSKHPVRPSAALLDTLKLYPWPGNVREFENVIEYLVNVMPDGGTVLPSMLPDKIRLAAGEQEKARADARRHGRHTPQADTPAGAGALGLPLLPSSPVFAVSDVEPDAGALLPILPLADMEQRAIKNALARFGSTTEGKRLAAEALGIGVATLYRKLKM